MVLSVAFAHDVLDWLRREIAAFDLLDWILLGAGAVIVGLAWCWQLGRVRLGTVQVTSVPATGTDGLAPHQIASLSAALCRIGLTAPGAVPSGSPKPDIVAAVAAAPIPDATWLGKIVDAIPFPTFSTSYVVNVTAQPAVGDKQGGVTYALMRSDGGTALVVRTVCAGSVDAALEPLATDIYCAIARNSPDIYPPWSQWPTVAALRRYQAGLDSYTANCPVAALADFEAARRLAPQNLLVRLRIANQHERKPGVLSPSSAPEACRTLAVLEEYLAIIECESAIYEAHYRAAVLLALLADRLSDWRRTAGSREARRAAVIARHLRGVLETHGYEVADDDPERVIAAARKYSRAHTCSAKWRLQPWWAIAHGRLRNRYELRGARRVQTRRARAISRLCMAMRAQPFYAATDPLPGKGQGLLRWALEVWLRYGYVALRWNRLGWQAHYNAACFYALMPEMAAGTAKVRERLTRRALAHLAYAAKSAGSDLSPSYVRYEDPDLARLRARRDWQVRIDRLYGRAAVVHYHRPKGDYDGWGLHVWAHGGPSVTQWADPVRFSAWDDYGVVFSVPIADLRGRLGCIVHNGEKRDCDARFFTLERGEMTEVWLRQRDPRVHDVNPKPPIAAPVQDDPAVRVG